MRVNEFVKQRLDPKCWTGKKIGTPKTKIKGGVRVNNCVPIEEDETGNVDDADSWQSQQADARRSAETSKMSQQDATAGGLAEADKKCPPATQDITLNLQNRQKAIDEYGYGPLNPDMPNRKFWMKKVDEWNLDSAEEAKQSLCGNCAAFDIREDTLDCIAQGIDSDTPKDAEGVIDAGDLGYCKFLKFKCASRRTCDAWVTGGPLTDTNEATVLETAIKGLYYNVNKRKKAGTSRPASHPKAPTAQAWKDAAKTKSVAEGSLADMRAHFDKNDPVADRPKHEINNKMPAEIIAILQKINNKQAVSKEEYLKLLAYKKSKGVAEGSLNEFAPGAGDEGGGEDPYKYPKPKRYARSADYFSQFEADHFDREDFDDATGVFKGYWGRTPIAYFKFTNPARTGGDDPGMGWYYEPESDGKGNDTGDGPAVDRSDERKQQELGMIRAFLKSGNRPSPGSQIHNLMKRHGMTEAAHTTNFNDDDWYEINPDTETIVSQQGPQAYRLPFGQRQIKLPNGNIVVRGMRAKHMRLNTGLDQSTKQ